MSVKGRMSCPQGHRHTVILTSVWSLLPLKVRNIITTAEQITLYYGTFRGPQRMNLADFGDLLNLHPSQPHNKMCPLVLSAGQNVPWHLLDGLAASLMQIFVIAR